MAMTPEERKERAWDLRLQRVYGITAAQYWEIFRLQNGCCALCGEAPRPGVKLVVDHDHKSKQVRGLLHANCNHRILGHTTLSNAQAICRYLANTPAYRVLGDDCTVPARKRKPRKKRGRLGST